ncbi:MAG: GTP-binding protein, partial [Bacteroidales bacterium]
IDVAYRYFSTNSRKFIIADTPGHEQYTRNMITGGSTANLAIILVDARTGVITQTKRHSFIVSLLGIKHVILAVNKMDLVDYSQEVFDNIVSDYMAFTKDLNIEDITPIPISALNGDNVVECSDNMDWYKGISLLDHLESVEVSKDRNMDSFRFPVQYVLRPNLDFRGFSGKVASGVIRKGDTVMALPSGKTSKVKSIVTYEGELEYAFAPQSITITLEDEIDISRGEMLIHTDDKPITSSSIESMLVWMDEEPMDSMKRYFIKHTTNTTRLHIDNIKYKVNINSMEKLTVGNGVDSVKDMQLQLNQIGCVQMTTARELFFDPYSVNKETGAFILIDPITHNTCAVGMIIGQGDSNSNLMNNLTINLSELGIDSSHYDAISKVIAELNNSGLDINLNK